MGGDNRKVALKAMTFARKRRLSLAHRIELLEMLGLITGESGEREFVEESSRLGQFLDARNEPVGRNTL